MADKDRVKRITIKQVAQRAEVSIATVSHVINGTAPISDETKKRVYAAIKELHYIPSATAKSLRTSKNNTIGLLIPNLNNNFYSKVTSTFVDLAYREGYRVQIHGYEYSLDRERQELELLERNDIGILVLFNGCNDEKEIQNFLKKGIPVILADRNSDIPGVPCIRFRNKDIMTEIVAVLKEKKYKRIGFVSEPLQLTNLKDRFEGYQNALKKFGYEFREEYVFIRDNLCLNNLENGYLYMKEILESRKQEELPDVFIASSDLLAIGLLRAIREYGYQVPRDFGVVGFDNIEISGFSYPRLTTVEQDQVVLAGKLLKLVKQVMDKEKRIEDISLEQKLILRDSC